MLEKAPAGEALRTFSEATGWDEDSARERDRQRRRVAAQAAMGTGGADAVTDAERAMLDQMAGRG